ncbi:MAG TPA: PucR family transcriptional regulator [Actinomycetales bacterium]|nr:PucR family transcriptional regulator [Actinomycetales bacterium]
MPLVVTVSDLLHQNALGLRAAHLPEPGALLRWTATSELPEPGAFLEGHELLLTTGLETAHWHEQWDAYVRHLVSTPVAAIGLGIGLTHSRIPAGLLEACRRQRLNLLEVPHRTTFVSVSRTTARLLDAQRDADDRATWQHQRALARAALSPGQPDALLHALAAAVRGQAALLDPDGVTHAGTDVPDPLREQARRLATGSARASAVLTGRRGAGLVHRVTPGAHDARFLAVWCEDGLGEARRRAVTSTVALLALTGEQQRRDVERDRHQRGAVARLLLAGQVEAAEALHVALAHAPARRVDRPTFPSSVRLVVASTAHDGAENLVTSIERACGESADVLPDVSRQGELRVVVPAEPLEKVTEAVRRAGARAGVGPVCEPAAVSGTLAAAVRALRLASPGEPVVVWEEVARRGPLALLDPEAAGQFARSFLGEVMDDPDLLATLRAYLTHHGSRGAAAAELGVHRNTVRNRVAQIERITGRSLDDANARASAWLAVCAVPG